MSKIMNDFDFMLPTTVRFGYGIHKQIADELKSRGKKKILIVSDKGLVKAGIVDKIKDVLNKDGFEKILLFDDVEPNPRDTTVQKGYEYAQSEGADAIVAIGGGSPMDTAKGIGVLMANGGTIKDYEGLDVVKEQIPTLITIPTTAGTGSEVTFWAVIKDTKENYKLSVGSTKIAAELAMVDPELMATLPSSVIAATGMDALTHAIEGYTATIAEPITDACGLYAIELISDNLRNAVYTDDLEARANMLIGSMLAGICFGNSDVGGCHCMSEALGGLYDTPHGIANAIMLPYTMEYNFGSDLDKFARIAQAMGVPIHTMSKRDAAEAGVKAVIGLNEDLIEIPTLREIGAKEEDLDELAMRAATNVSVESNPRKVTKEDFLEIFKKAMAV